MYKTLGDKSGGCWWKRRRTAFDQLESIKNDEGTFMYNTNSNRPPTASLGLIVRYSNLFRFSVRTCVCVCVCMCVNG